jgi:hypothetical protein
MELLIPGLILVALMVWASTKIKKQAADAFEEEVIETERYSLHKPEGFLHVIGDPDHEVMAYSRDYGTGDKIGVRRATIELDIFPGNDLATVRDNVIQSATESRPGAETDGAYTLETDETVNEFAFLAFYKIVAGNSETYRLRFAVLAEHADDYLRKIDETLDSFTVQ